MPHAIISSYSAKSAGLCFFLEFCQRTAGFQYSTKLFNYSGTSVILISVPDIEIAVKKNQSGSDCDYNHIMLEELYKLLSPEVTMEERKKFFADKNIDSGGEYSMDIFQILRKELAEKDEELAKKDEEMAKKDKEMAKKDKTIAALMAELAKLQANPQK